MVEHSIDVDDAAIGLRRTSKNKRDMDKKMRQSVCFTAVELEKNVTSYDIFLKYSYVQVLLVDGGAVKKTLGHSTDKTNPTTWNHIFQLQRQSRGP